MAFENIIFHDSFTHDWMRAFPLGNGKIGAMVYGNPDCETIELNEETLRSGNQFQEKTSATKESLDKIRSLLFDNKFNEAAEICTSSFLTQPARVRFYESFGELFIDFNDKSEYKNYKKLLDMERAVVETSYTKGDSNYNSTTLVSEQRNLMCYRMRCNKPFSASVAYCRAENAFTAPINNNTLVMWGKLVYSDHVDYGEGGEGMSFGARIVIQSDGSQSISNRNIKVENATWLTVYVALATNYDVNKFDFDESIDIKSLLDSYLSQINNVTFDEIKSLNEKQHQKLYSRVKLDLGNSDEKANIATDKRLEAVKNGQEDIGLYTLLYNYGRYLLIESSAKRAVLPANLQGIWCNGFTPPWGADYHTNINLQMNYWHAECSNIPESVKCYIHFMKMLSHFGVETAQKVFFSKGWACNHTTDIFGKTGVHDSVQCGFFPMAGPWLCLNLWEHYEYGQSRAVLEEIYPIMKGACEFIEGYLIEDKIGRLVTSPSNSPENMYYYIDANGEKQKSMFTYGSTMDFEIIRSLLTRTIYASSLLGDNSDFSNRMNYILSKLPEIRVSERYGTIAEWIEDFEETEPGHRHISQLYALYPDDAINQNNALLFNAAKNTIKRRLDNGGAATGWSRAWVINFYARLKDGENALYNLRRLLQISTADNMFDMHPPFQIDGNFGATSGITEMLLQSHDGRLGKRNIELLPALPQSFNKGSVEGLRARGGFELSFSWENSVVTSLTIKSNCGGTLNILATNKLPLSQLENKYNIKNNIISLETTKGEIIKII